MRTTAEILAQAIDHHRAGRFGEAIECYRQGLEADANQADAWHFLGAAQHQKGDSQAAAASIRRAIDLKPGVPAYHNSLGVALRALKETDSAIGSYRRALELSPDFPDALNNLGVALREHGDLDEAIACYVRALEMKPDSPGTTNNLASVLKALGDALCSQGMRGEAIDAYRRALELKPDYVDAHLNLGNALLSQGHVADAAEAYRRAIELRPLSAEAHNNLGTALLQQHESEEAIRYWQRALELKTDYPEALCNLGVAMNSAGDREGAAHYYRCALALNPVSVEAHNNLGNVLRAQCRMDEAIECWQTALRIKPDCGEARTTLTMMLYGLGRPAEAAEVVREWIAIAPHDPVARHMHAAFTGQDVPLRASDEYVRSTFDHFAGNFEQQLQKLEYQAPQLVAAAVADVLGQPQGNLDVLDAGCGTGWCGPFVRSYARQLTGVDLSPAMVERAGDRKVYDELVVAELTEYLQKATEPFDMIISADTLVYFGDLREVLAAAARALRREGVLIFTVERSGDDRPDAPDFYLQHHGRYCHSERYIRAILQDAGFTVPRLAEVVLRKEMDQPVHGLLVTAVRPRNA